MTVIEALQGEKRSQLTSLLNACAGSNGDCGADQLFVDVKKAVAKARQNEAAAKAEAEKRRMAELERQLECQQVWSPGFRTALKDSARPACT